MGRLQARALAAHLVAAELPQLLCSPAVRCLETLQPAAQAIGRSIEQVPALAEGHSGAAALTLIEGLSRRTALCSHGDVIGELLELLVDRGVLRPGQVRAAKGSVWDFAIVQGEVVRATYRPAEPRRAPPAG